MWCPDGEDAVHSCFELKNFFKNHQWKAKEKSLHSPRIQVIESMCIQCCSMLRYQYFYPEKSHPIGSQVCHHLG